MTTRTEDTEHDMDGVREPRANFDMGSAGAPTSSSLPNVISLSEMQRAMDKYAEALAELAK